MSILSWYENFVEEEIPAETIWDDAEGLDQHFKAVKARKEDGRPSYTGDDDDDGDGSMVGNDIADVFKD